MPLLVGEVGTTTSGLWGRPIRIGDLPVFNSDDRDFIIEDLEGWEDTGTPDAVFVPNGGAAGALASGGWLSAEAYLTVVGTIFAGAEQQALMRQLLLAGLPADREATLIVYGNGDRDKQAFVRRYDKPAIVRDPVCMSFTVPLIMCDPYKYALEPLSGIMGTFSGETWYREYADAGSAKWVRSYVNDSGMWWRGYQQFEPSSGLPESLTLTSDGDAASQRLTFTVAGPLSAGDWWLLHETTGARLWANLDVPAGQTLELDCAAKTATLAGAEASHTVYGDWLQLIPGTNVFRLVSGTSSAAYATVTALEAYL